MKTLKAYLEELFVSGSNTLGIGNPTPPGNNGELGSGDMIQPMCIDIKTGKFYKRRKKFRRYKI